MNKGRLFLISGFIFLIRILFLGEFPIGITHDELNYVIAAKSLFWTGTFAPGTAPALLPTSMAHFNVVIAEVPALILSLFIGLIPTTLFTARFVGVILSVFSALAVYFLVIEMTKRKNLALVSVFLYAINPWSFLMGRTIFEVNFFNTFFLWGLYFLIAGRGRKIFYALPLYLLGFLSYTGGQLSFYLFAIITLLFSHILQKKSKKATGLYFLFWLIMTLVFVFYLTLIFRNQSFIARGRELFLPTNPEVSSLVNENRQLAVPSVLNNLFLNKATEYFHQFGRKYLKAFSVEQLFLQGETRAAFSLQKHGSFYWVDFIFILLGLSWLWRENKKIWFLFTGIIAIGPLTSGLNLVEYSYSQRAGLMYPFLIIIITLGIGALFDLFSNKDFRKVVAVVLVFVYTVLFANLLHIYFFRFPIYASDGWFFQDRLLVHYLNLSQKETVVYTKEPKIIFQEYLFYNNLYKGENIIKINEEMNRGMYQFNKVNFTDICPKSAPTGENVLVFSGDINCALMPAVSGALRITRFKDVYEEYLIFNDVLCGGYGLGRFVTLDAYKDFNIEKQSPEKYCASWITKL